MERFESTLNILAPARLCYECWMQFERFPGIVDNVKSVARLGDNLWRWVVYEPFCKDTTWDTELDEVDERNHRVSWHSLTPSRLLMRGAVRFDVVTPEKTRLRFWAEYEGPEDDFGMKEVMSEMTHFNHRLIEKDLKSFKRWVEGQHMEIQPVLTKVDAAPVMAAMASESQGEGIQPGYQGGYGLEDDIPETGLSASNETESEDIEPDELDALRQEENPYLAATGAIYTEDEIDRRADEDEPEMFDIFEESMDVDEEDLASFTEDLDDDIDGALPGRSPYEELSEPYSRSVDVSPGTNPSK